MDNITLNRIKLLHPKIRKEVYDMYVYANNKLLMKGIRLRFAYTLRTNQEQDAIYAQGRTKLFDNAGKRLGVVTNAKGGQSIHNYGLAFDIVLLIDKDGDGNFESVSWDVKADYNKNGLAEWIEIANYFKSKGWSWGGDWKKLKDAPHFEKTFGHNWKTLKSLYDKGKTFTENISGKDYIYVEI